MMKYNNIKLISILSCLVGIHLTRIFAMSFSDYEIIKLYNCTDPGKNNYISLQLNYTISVSYFLSFDSSD